jgi:hypothetical protein
LLPAAYSPPPPPPTKPMYCIPELGITIFVGAQSTMLVSLFIFETFIRQNTSQVSIP